ncbi:MAG: homogentisate 1,2-dioxygenase [Acidimicrobiales bacterium]
MTSGSLLSGFGNHFETEAVAGALPVGRNSPQRPAFGLYAEQLSGTAFTAPRAENRRTWTYRRRPSVRHLTGFGPREHPGWRTAPHREVDAPMAPMRWDPTPLPDSPVHFLDSITTLATNGDAHLQVGLGVHVYAATAPMDGIALLCADGEMVLVPQLGTIRITTELGVLDAPPGHVVGIPRGMCFRVDPVDGPIRGWIAENHGHPLRLPERGPIGANGLADERDFLHPIAAFDPDDRRTIVHLRAGGRSWTTEHDHSPFDVVAWHGNLAPWVYDLRRFTTIGSISHDHPDPSIFTVLTSPSDTPGVANLDLVVFGDRWLVAEDTFRPPWFHRNTMSELMGLIDGVYDAKPQGFVPGGTSLHNQFLPHGPSAEAHRVATEAHLVPEKLADTLAFMFESRYRFLLTEHAIAHPGLQPDYDRTWDGLEDRSTFP